MSMGLFLDDNGKLPRDFRERAIEMLRLGSYGSIMGENELQLKNARRENSLLGMGKVPCVDIYDDDELHISEHRRFALQMSFRLLRERDPRLAAEFDRHIEEHRKRTSEKEIGRASVTDGRLN